MPEELIHTVHMHVLTTSSHEYSDVSDEHDFCYLHCYEECNYTTKAACPLHCGESCPFWDEPLLHSEYQQGRRKNSKSSKVPKVPFCTNTKFDKYPDEDVSVREVLRNIGTRVKSIIAKKITGDKEPVLLLFLVSIWSVMILSFLFH